LRDRSVARSLAPTNTSPLSLTHTVSIYSIRLSIDLSNLLPTPSTTTTTTITYNPLSPLRYLSISPCSVTPLPPFRGPTHIHPRTLHPSNLSLSLSRNQRPSTHSSLPSSTNLPTSRDVSAACHHLSPGAADTSPPSSWVLSRTTSA